MSWGNRGTHGSRDNALTCGNPTRVTPFGHSPDRQSAGRRWLTAQQKVYESAEESTEIASEAPTEDFLGAPERHAGRYRPEEV